MFEPSEAKCLTCGRALFGVDKRYRECVECEVATSGKPEDA